MTHLTPAEFVDLLDGSLEEARAAHVRGCRTCAAQADDLRRTLADAAMPAHEPSPLFWEHFSARVSNAIRHEPFPAPGVSWTTWLRRPAFSLSLAAAVIALATLAAVLNRQPIPGVEAPAPAADVGARGAEWENPELLDHEDAWAVLSAAVEDIPWDEAQEAGLSPGPGAAAKALVELTAEERAELASLLQEEMQRPGA